MVNKKICPRCKSEDVKFDWATAMVGRTIIDSYTCNKCGHTSRFFPEIGEKQ